MQGIHQIFVTLDRISGCLIHHLTPVWRTDQNDSILVIGSNRLDHGLGIAFDL